MSISATLTAPSRTRYIITALLFLTGVINYLDRYLVAGILPRIEDSLHIDHAQGGLLQSIFIVGLGTKALWRSIFWILVASLFHASAFIVAVLVALSYTRDRLQAAALLLVSAIPAYYVLFSTFDIYLRRYGQHRIDSGGVTFRVAMNAVPAIILLVRGSKAYAPRNEELFWRSLSWLSLALVPAMFFVKSTTAIDRLSLYAVPLQILVLSVIPSQLSTSPATRIFPVMAVIAYCAATLLVYLALGTHAQYYLPYAMVDLW